LRHTGWLPLQSMPTTPEGATTGGEIPVEEVAAV